ncbi:MAG: cell surface protein [Alistipes sp.]|nr:cell surface protein [Alistipes sp.]
MITDAQPPKILLDKQSGIYSVKQGDEIRIAPNYESADGADFRWTMDGEVISTRPSLNFYSDKTGKFYVTITVTTEAGSSSEEIRIDVTALEVPTISIISDKSLCIAVGSTLSLRTSVKATSLTTSVVWSLNGEEVAEGEVFDFEATTAGTYTIMATASNDDGSHSDSIEVEVRRKEDMPLLWEFDSTSYHTVVGRKLLIEPSATSHDSEVTYLWKVVGESEAAGSEPHLIFTAERAGEYQITATATLKKESGEVTLRHTFDVTVYEAGAFRRKRSESSKAEWNKVYEYTPAPGQFINELKTGGFDGTQTTPEAAIAYAEQRMSQCGSDGTPNPVWVSLGGFGGYIVVGFDHSIDNSGDYDLGVIGNSFNGSSEPGIVWVMQDENGNGLPDDTWYELAGSESGKSETTQNYAVTYYRPSGAGMPVQWTDNQGNSGQIDYLRTYHSQEYYYPLWIVQESYTLTGTCLKARNSDASGKGSYWVNAHYDWGYADNYSSIDRLSGDENANAEANANHFKISNAIDFEGEPIHLEFIDFVKVQCAVNAKSGWLGELSTEVFGFYDYNMER